MSEKSLEAITFSRGQTALLEQLIEDWREKGKREIHNAEVAPNPQRIDEARRTASCLFACADQLRDALSTGNLPAHFGFQMRKTPHRGLN